MGVNRIEIGNLIEIVDERNSDGSISAFYGININKEFMPTVATTDGIDSNKYKIIRKNRFVFSGMQTGRDECIRIGLYTEEEPIIVSPAYTTFEIIKQDLILNEYFFMNFLSKEMDRYGWFLSDSSVRSNLDWERFCEIEILLSSLSIQKKYVDVYNAIIKNASLRSKIKDICPILIKGAIEDSKKGKIYD
jgi:type I restriction enzyme S subunit